jgi:hypothetical protein
MAARAIKALMAPIRCLPGRSSRADDVERKVSGTLAIVAEAQVRVEAGQTDPEPRLPRCPQLPLGRPDRAGESDWWVMVAKTQANRLYGGMDVSMGGAAHRGI